MHVDMHTQYLNAVLYLFTSNNWFSLQLKQRPELFLWSSFKASHHFTKASRMIELSKVVMACRNIWHFNTHTHTQIPSMLWKDIRPNCTLYTSEVIRWLVRLVGACVSFSIIYVIICRQVAENNCELFQQATKIDRSTLLMRGVNTQQAFQARSIVVSGHTHVQHWHCTVARIPFHNWPHFLPVHTECMHIACESVCVLVNSVHIHK